MNLTRCVMIKFITYTDPLEKKLNSFISVNNIMKHLRIIAQWERESGTEGEKKAFDYIEKELRSLKISTKRFECETFISLPRDGWVKILNLEAKKIDGLPSSFSVSTPREGIKGELISLRGDLNFKKENLSGKILLIDYLPTPNIAREAENHGVIGIISAGHEKLYCMTISSLWGTPTFSKRHLIPKIPCISILKKDGDFLREYLKKGPVLVQIFTNVWNGFKKIPILTGDLRGRVEKDRFLLLSGHVDSWYFGAYDNAAGNGALIEIARLLQKNSFSLRRGVRLIFWSGHSQGRYAGSTWYADQNWEELYQKGIVHLNIDCIGAKGATDYSNLFGTEDTWDLGERIIFKFTKQRVKAKHFPRAGDQSFWGIGIPSLFMDLSGFPPEKGMETAHFLGTNGLPWWWHTKEDTLDKIDPKVLALDTKIYLSTILTFCNSPIIPLNEERAAKEILKRLKEYQAQYRMFFDLSKSIEEAQILLKWVRKLNQRIDQDLMTTRRMLTLDSFNVLLMRLSRKLIPILYTSEENFDHDLAVPMNSIPSLQSLSILSRMNSKENDFKFLKTEIIRKQNRVIHYLKEAYEAIQSILK